MLRKLESPSQFYGREDELARFDSYLSGDSHLLVVRGDPGMGKTTLTREAIGKYGRGHKTVEFEMENANSMLPSSIFTGIVMDLLGNPDDYQGVVAGLRDWYGEDVEGPENELLISALHSYHNFSGYDGSNFSGRRQEEGLDDALVHFFSNGSYERPVAIQLSNYERRHLGDNPQTDDTLVKISEGVGDKPLYMIVETRDDLVLGDRINLGPIGEDHLTDNYRDVRDVELIDVDKIRGITRGHPYANALVPHFQGAIGSLKEGARLEDILDIVLARTSNENLSVLQFVSAAEGPISVDNLVKANEQIESLDLYDSISRLITNRLVAVTKKNGETYFDARNPRLGERAISRKHIGAEDLRKLHRIHYGLVGNDNDRFVHAAAAEMDEETYEVARLILDRVPLRDAIGLTETAVRVLDDANSVEYNVKRAKRAVEMLYETGRKRLWLGEYAIPDVHSQIRLRRDKIVENDTDSERDAALLWQEATFGFLPALAKMDYDTARGYHGLFMKAAQLDEGRMAAANHLETHIFKDRACFDPSIDDFERRRLLGEVDRVLGYQLSTEDNLGDTDKNHLAFSLAELATLHDDHNRNLLLERAAGLIEGSFEGDELPWRLVDIYDTRGLIRVLQEDVDGAVEDLEESRRLSSIYGGSRKTMIEGLTAARIVARMGDDRLGSVRKIDSEIESLIKGSGSDIYFNFPHLIKTRDRLLGFE